MLLSSLHTRQGCSLVWMFTPVRRASGWPGRGEQVRQWASSSGRLAVAWRSTAGGVRRCTLPLRRGAEGRSCDSWYMAGAAWCVRLAADSPHPAGAASGATGRPRYVVARDGLLRVIPFAARNSRRRSRCGGLHSECLPSGVWNRHRWLSTGEGRQMCGTIARFTRQRLSGGFTGHYHQAGSLVARGSCLVGWWR